MHHEEKNSDEQRYEKSFGQGTTLRYKSRSYDFAKLEEKTLWYNQSYELSLYSILFRVLYLKRFQVNPVLNKLQNQKTGNLKSLSVSYILKPLQNALFFEMLNQVQHDGSCHPGLRSGISKKYAF